MKKLSLSILLLLSFMTLSAKQKVETYNTKQSSLFYLNNGQIINQDRKVRKDVNYHYSAPGFALSLLDKGMSWTVTKVERFSLNQSAAAEQNDKIGIISGRSEKDKQDSVVFHTHRMDIEFVNCSPNIQSDDAEISDYYQNYYTEYTGEKGVTDVHGSKQVTLKNVWNKIDIVFHAKEEGKVEYDFIVHPGGNIKDIQLKYKSDGVEQNLVSSDKIVFKTSVGEVEETIPSSYYLVEAGFEPSQVQNQTQNQENKNNEPRGGVNPAPTPVISYSKLSDNVMGFVSESQLDKTKTLVIDPQLVWGTYYGGIILDRSIDISTDAFSDVYITGYTQSPTMIATSGAHQTSLGGGGYIDAFLVKFNSSGVRQWSTYYCGRNDDFGSGITTDTFRYIYMVGSTVSTSGIATSSGHQTSYGGGNEDAFLVKFNNSGIRQWGTYYGGSNYDYSQDVSTDASGNVFMTGNSQSTSGIAASGAHQISQGGRGDAFLVKFNNSGIRQWATYYGQNGADMGSGVCTDSSGNVYITGKTESTAGIATSGAQQTSHGGSEDGFLVKFNNSGVRLWGTYYGQSGGDGCNDICTDLSNNVYITGSTWSTAGIGTSGAHQTSLGGNNYHPDAFLVKFNDLGVRQWSSYFGGEHFEGGEGVSTDISGNVYITGYTFSTINIATSGAYQTSLGGNYDAFLAKFNNTGVYQWGTYYGGNGYEAGSGISIDPSNNLYVTGSTQSSSNIATSGAHQTSHGGINYGDAFLAKFSDTSTCTTPNVNVGIDKFICFGGSGTTIGLTPVNGHFYRWTSSPSGYTSISSNPAINPSSTTTYYLKDSISGGCFNYDTIIVNVVSAPIANAGIDKTICLGGSGTLIGSTSVNGHFYKWTTASTSYTNSTANPSVRPFSTTTYYLKDSISGGCFDYDTVIVNVIAAPIAKAGINKSICFGGSGTSIGSSSVSGHFYQWTSSPTGYNNSTANPTVNPSTTTTYYLKDSVQGGCFDLDTVVVNVITILSANAGNDKSICIGGSGTTIGSSNISGHYYKWTSFPTGYSNTSSNPIVNPLSTTIYYLKDSVSGGCFYYDTVIVTVNPKPINNLGNDTTVYLGVSLTLGSPFVLGNTYLWSTSATTSQITVNTSSVGTIYYKLTVSNATVCQTVDSILIIVNATKTWTGAISSDWNNANNWNPSGVPTLTDSVVIPSASSYNKRPTVSSNAKAKALNVLSGAIVRLINGSTIEIKQSYTLQGTINSPIGNTFRFTGTTLQSISGVFDNIEIDNPVGVVISNNTSVSGLIKITNGNLYTNDKLTLNTDEKRPSGIYTLPSGSKVIGKVIVNRPLLSGVFGWTLISPSTYGLKLNNWGGRLRMYGFGTLGSNPNGAGLSSVYKYNEPSLGPKDTGWMAPTSYSDTMQLGKGWNIYAGSTKTNLTSNGYIAQQGFTFPISYTNNSLASDGWNLMGNPYPCAIDWNGAGWTKSNMDSAIYTYNENTGQYAVWNGTVGVNGQSRYIAIGQAFFVKANNSSAVLSASESSKSLLNAKLHKTDLSANQLTIKLQNTQGHTDEAIIGFNPTATNGYDGHSDGYKFRGRNVYLASKEEINKQDLSINYLDNNLSVKRIIPFSTDETFTKEVHTLTINGKENFSPDVKIYLHDISMDKMMDISTSNTYQYTPNGNKDRFEIIVNPMLEEGKKSEIISDIKIYPNPTKNILNIMSMDGENHTYSIKDMNGRTILQNNFTGNTQLNLTLPKGIYMIEVQSVNKVKVEKLVVE